MERSGFMFALPKLGAWSGWTLGSSFTPKKHIPGEVVITMMVVKSSVSVNTYNGLLLLESLLSLSLLILDAISTE